MNKLGSYISKLMTTILDSEQEQFVKELALNELTRLNVDVNEFIKNALDSMYDKLEASGKFKDVKDEFEAIAGIVSLVDTWDEVQ